MWLQVWFPAHIWIIAAFIIVSENVVAGLVSSSYLDHCCIHNCCFINVSSATPVVTTQVLATLFLLSYPLYYHHCPLLHIVNYPDDSIATAVSVPFSCTHPYVPSSCIIYVTIFLFLWLPYTVGLITKPSFYKTHNV